MNLFQNLAPHNRPLVPSRKCSRSTSPKKYKYKGIQRLEMFFSTEASPSPSLNILIAPSLSCCFSCTFTGDGVGDDVLPASKPNIAFPWLYCKWPFWQQQTRKIETGLPLTKPIPLSKGKCHPAPLWKDIQDSKAALQAASGRYELTSSGVFSTLPSSP